MRLQSYNSHGPLNTCLPARCIVAACSRWFYGGRLRDGVAAADKPPAAGVDWPVPDCPVMMLGIQGLEEKAEKSGQKVNCLRMRACVRVCECVCVWVGEGAGVGPQPLACA
jgi:hypothetical protein